MNHKNNQDRASEARNTDDRGWNLISLEPDKQ
jgi:hypothetical protein